MNHHKNLLHVLVAAGVFALTTTAHAEDAQPNSVAQAERTRALLERGVEAASAGELTNAREAFMEAWNMRKSYDVAGLLGQVELELKLFRDAAEHLDYAIRDFAPGAKRATLEGFQTGLAAAKAQVGTLHLNVLPEGATILIDQGNVGTSPLGHDIFVEPGAHHIEARYGAQRTELTVSLHAGEEQRVPLRVRMIQPTTPTPVPQQHKDNPSWTPILLGGGIALAGFAVGVGFSVAASDRRDDVRRIGNRFAANGCSPGSAPSADCGALRKAYDEERRDAQIAIAGMAVGAAASVVTLAYWLFRPSSAPSSNGSARFIPSFASDGKSSNFSLSGTF